MQSQGEECFLEKSKASGMMNKSREIEKRVPARQNRLRGKKVLMMFEVMKLVQIG